MSDEQPRITGVDHTDSDAVIVEYSDRTTAVFTAEDLGKLPNKRTSVRPDELPTLSPDLLDK